MKKASLVPVLLCLVVILPMCLAAEQPQVVRTVPPLSARDVDPSLTELIVEFDQPMKDGSWSWCGGGEDFPELTGTPFYRDETTAVLPVKLKPNHAYALSINCPSAQNFRSAEGHPAQITRFSFRTGPGSGDEQTESAPPARPPMVVSTTPPLSARDVDPSLTELIVEFDQPMKDGSWSWCGGGENFPELTGTPFYRDETTAVLPVTLRPNHLYSLGINCPSAQNFRSAEGLSARTTWFTFTTGSGDGTTPDEPAPQCPIVVSTSPANGAMDVDPTTREIVVTFDQPMMDGAWSWCRHGENYPESTGMPTYRDERTAVLPVKLQPETTYSLSINHPTAQNFKTPDHLPAQVYPITFTTRSKEETNGGTAR